MSGSLSAAHAQVEVAWNSTSNQFPNELCPWTLFDEAQPEDPLLSGQILRLATSDDFEWMFYQQHADSVIIPSQLIIEARLKVNSEVHQDGPRRGVAVVFAVEPDRENILQIGMDEIFLWSAFGAKGVSAFVDTEDAFHTFRITVTELDAVSVYYDGGLVFSGNILTD